MKNFLYIFLFFLLSLPLNFIKAVDKQTCLCKILEKDELLHQIQTCEQILKRLNTLKTLQEKTDFLIKVNFVYSFLRNTKQIESLLDQLSCEDQFAILSIIAIHEGPHVLLPLAKTEDYEEKMIALAKYLCEINRIYQSQGGLIGYHLATLKALYKTKYDSKTSSFEHALHYPPHYNLEQTKYLNKWIYYGISALPEMAEAYLVGGAADRLKLTSETTHQPLPAGFLLFDGHTLLEKLIRDIQAREYLYAKIYDKQVLTPLILMTSEDHDNHFHITNFCKEKEWFGRPQNLFHFLIQPIVPVITESGHWAMNEQHQLCTKPNGHGAFWQLFDNNNSLQWLKDHARKAFILRQINNPICGLDSHLLAYYGIGKQGKKTFGFSACPSGENVTAGKIAFFAKKTKKGFFNTISNIEYTELQGTLEKQTAPYPMGANVLYVDIDRIYPIVKKNLIPNFIINFKTEFPYFVTSSEIEWEKGGRLESCVQNIADNISYRSSDKCMEIASLPTFVALQKTNKLLSAIKNADNSASLKETPTECYINFLKNHIELLQNHCLVYLPEPEEQDLVDNSFLHFSYHPALGPLYSIIGQKIHHGVIHKGSEVKLEIAELYLKDFDIDGSCIITSTSVLGHQDEHHQWIYSDKAGKCFLHNVSIKNQGIDYSQPNIFWKGQIHRKESFEIVLHEMSEFHAENVSFVGNFSVEVPPYQRCYASQEGDQITLSYEPIDSPTWFWKYIFGPDNTICLTR